MNKPRSDVAFTPAVKALQERLGSRQNYEETERDSDWWLDRITPDLAAFIELPLRIVLGWTLGWRPLLHLQMLQRQGRLSSPRLKLTKGGQSRCCRSLT